MSRVTQILIQVYRTPKPVLFPRATLPTNKHFQQVYYFVLRYYGAGFES